jgi:hypothetical protein
MRGEIMPKQGYYRKMFFIGAVWNWGATLSFALGYTFIFSLFNMELPKYPIFFLLFLGLAFSFGLGYYWVSKDLHANHGIVKMGIVGKLIVFVGILWACIAGQIHFVLLGAGVADLIFAVLFIEFLMTYRRSM